MSTIIIVALSALVWVIIAYLVNQIIAHFKDSKEEYRLLNETIDNQREIIDTQTKLLDGKSQQIQLQNNRIEANEFIQKNDWDLIKQKMLSLQIESDRKGDRNDS